jgi:hypothetical protein
MGLDFDIVNITGELINRYPIKWLYYYDSSFINSFTRSNTNTNTNIKNIISYCDEHIYILKSKTDEFDKIDKIKYLEFNEKKEYLMSLIVSTNDNEELNELIDLIYSIVYEKVEDSNYSTLKNFESFKLFLEKYIEYKYEISY